MVSIRHPGMSDEPLTEAELDRDINEDALETIEIGLPESDPDPNIVAEDVVRINDSGIVPTEFKVLVLPDESEVELRARRSGLVVPDEAAGMYRHAAVTGRIIAMSPAAFSYHDWPEGVRLPVVGDRVTYARYAGMRVNGRPRANEKGHDESVEYRLLNDKDIAAVLEF